MSTNVQVKFQMVLDDGVASQIGSAIENLYGYIDSLAKEIDYSKAESSRLGDGIRSLQRGMQMVSAEIVKMHQATRDALLVTAKQHVQDIIPGYGALVNADDDYKRYKKYEGASENIEKMAKGWQPNPYRHGTITVPESRDRGISLPDSPRLSFQGNSQGEVTSYTHAAIMEETYGNWNLSGLIAQVEQATYSIGTSFQSMFDDQATPSVQQFSQNWNTETESWSNSAQIQFGVMDASHQTMLGGMTTRGLQHRSEDLAGYQNTYGNMIPLTLQEPETALSLSLVNMTGAQDTFFQTSDTGFGGYFGTGGIIPSYYQQNKTQYGASLNGMSLLTNSWKLRLDTAVGDSITAIFRGEFDSLGKLWEGVLNSMLQDLIKWGKGLAERGLSMIWPARLLKFGLIFK